MIDFEEFRAVADAMTERAELSAVARHYKMFKNDRACDDAVVFLQQHLIPTGYVLISNAAERLKSHLKDADTRIRKWCTNRKSEVLDTIGGWAISEQVYSELLDYVEHTYPIKEVIDSVSNGNLEPKDSAAIRMLAGKSVITNNYHPMSYERFYFLGDRHDAKSLVNALLADYFQKPISEIVNSDYLTVRLAADYFQITPSEMKLWMEENRSQVAELCGQLLITKACAEKLMAEKTKLVPMDAEQIKNFLHIRDDQAQLLSKAAIKYNSDLVDQMVPNNLYPGLKKSLVYCIDLQHAYNAVVFLRNSASIIPTMMLAKEFELSVSGVTAQIAKSQFGQLINGKWYLTLREYDDICYTAQHYLSVDDVVKSMLPEQSRFEFRKQDVEKLFAHCDENDWWGIDYRDATGIILESPKTGKLIHQDSQNLFREKNRLFLDAYLLPPEDQINIYCRHYASAFPIAAKELRAFSNNVSSENKRALCEMADLLFCWMVEHNGDIDSFVKSDYLNLAVVFDHSAMRVTCRLLAAFLKNNNHFTHKLEFSSTGYHPEVSHYPFDAYMQMASYICDKACWEDHSLIQKAVNSSRNASVWLFLAMHFLSSLRTTDLNRLDPPYIGATPETILDLIKNNCFTDEQAISVYLSFVVINNAYQMTPNKTAKAVGVAPIYIHCPVDFQVEFGTILAIASAHYQLEGCNGSFVRTNVLYNDLKKFFGDEFCAICGRRNFSTRRANKTLMQMVYEQSLIDGESAYKAYMLVSSMRSHKVADYMISDTTARYLSSEVDGLAPEIVAFQLFERGSCSYLIDKLLEACYGSQYKRLGFSERTKVIQEVGLTPYELSQLREIVLESEAQAARIVQQLGVSSDAAREALMRILSDNAHNKTLDGDCLMAAINRTCTRRDLQTCVFCPFSLSIQTLYLRLLSEHRRLNMLMSRAVNDQERKRLAYIDTSLVRPALVSLIDNAAVYGGQNNLVKSLQVVKDTYSNMKGASFEPGCNT